MTPSDDRMDDATLRDFLQAYGVGASKALGIEADRLHVKGGEGPDGQVLVALDIDGESATPEQMATVRAYLRSLTSGTVH